MRVSLVPTNSTKPDEKRVNTTNSRCKATTIMTKRLRRYPVPYVRCVYLASNYLEYSDPCQLPRALPKASSTADTYSREDENSHSSLFTFDNSRDNAPVLHANYAHDIENFFPARTVLDVPTSGSLLGEPLLDTIINPCKPIWTEITVSVQVKGSRGQHAVLGSKLCRSFLVLKVLGSKQRPGFNFMSSVN